MPHAYLCSDLSSVHPKKSKQINSPHTFWKEQNACIVISYIKQNLRIYLKGLETSEMAF